MKFLRKIRQNLLMENKTGKYLKYAIGEIVLVVIGILIALQINNLNQNRANESKIASILAQIERELIEDVHTASELNLYWELKDSLYTVAMSDSVTIEMYRESKSLRHFFMGMSKTLFKRMGLNY